LSSELAETARFALSWRAIQYVGVKLVYLARLLVLARLLAPEDFGLLAVATVAIDFLLHVTNLGMIPALVQKTDADERHFDAVWTVGILRAGLITCGVALAAPWIADLFAEPRATDIIRALALRPLIEAAASIGVARLTRDLRFRTLAVLWLGEALANTLLTVALAFFLGVWALVIGALAGPLVFAVLSYVAAPHRPRLRLDDSAIRSLVRFGRWVFVTGLIALAGRSILQATISRELGVAELGLYSLAARLAFLPAEVSSAVVGSVAFPLFARLQAEPERTATAFRTMFIGLIVLLLPLVGLLVTLAPSLVHEVLAPRWQGTAPLITLLAIASAIGLLGDTAVPMFEGLGRPQLVTVIEAVQSTCLAGLAWVLADHFGLIGAVFAWIPALLASQVACLVFLRVFSPRCLVGLGTPLAMVLGVAAMTSATAYAIDRSLGGMSGLVLAIAVSAVVALVLLLSGDRILGLGLVDSLARVFPRLSFLQSDRTA
jgi:O-antigen/teichoic acid export membrane protein